MNETDNPLCTDSNLRLDKLMEASVPSAFPLRPTTWVLHKGVPLSPYFRHTFGPNRLEGDTGSKSKGGKQLST